MNPPPVLTLEHVSALVQVQGQAISAIVDSMKLLAERLERVETYIVKEALTHE